MNHERQDSDLQAFYAESVEREREAWQTLQSHPPGSIGRARAWEAWSQSIMLTNQAWRRLNAERAVHPLPHRAQGAGSHANA